MEMSLTAQVPDEELDQLERRIALDVSRLEPGTFRDTKELAEEPDEVEVPSRDDLRSAAEDLLAHARTGISIAAQVESRPLVPMFEAAGEKPPPAVVADQASGYEYYVVEVTTTVLLPEDQRPLSATLAIRLADDVADESRKLRPYRLFPAREDVELFSVNVEGAVGLNADLSVVGAGHRERRRPLRIRRGRGKDQGGHRRRAVPVPVPEGQDRGRRRGGPERRLALQHAVRALGHEHAEVDPGS